MSKNIIEFPSKRDYHYFVKKQIVKEIGDGSEGVVYLTRNHEAIKENYCLSVQYLNDDILMESDVKLKSFLFPKELYVVGNGIVGYKTDYFRNIFKLFDGNIRDINIDAVIAAGYNMIDDIRALTDMHYVLFDLPNNILFDVKELRAIYTLQYYRRDTVTLDENISIMRDAITTALLYHDELCSMATKDHLKRTLKKEFR